MAKTLPASRTTADEEIISRIHLIRGSKVMPDKDLAEMYSVEVKRLNEAVRRNSTRFPDDFMFQLTTDEWGSLRSQIATLEKDPGRGKYSKFLPYAFTEQGVAMLSSVLRSETTIQVNIQIIRVYTKMRQLVMDNKDLQQRMESLERRMDKKDEEVAAIFAAFKKLLTQEEKPRNKVGFVIPTTKKQ